MKKTENKKKNIILFFIKMILLFVVFDIILNNITPLFISVILQGKYGNQVIVEACAAFLVLLIIILFKNTYIFNEKKDNFFKSLGVGAFMLVLSILILIVNLTSSGTFAIADILSLAIFCFLIGIFEEFLCRGWIQNEFIERFAKNRKEVILSIILSSLIFGGMHITNIWLGGQGVLETIAQIIQATGLGILLGSVYYRTKNIWASVFLHGFWDFAVFLGQVNIIKDCTTVNTSTQYLLYTLASSILLTVVYILISMYILRKSKTNKIIEEYSEEEIQKSEKNKNRLIWAIVIVYLAINNLPIQEADEVCYEYGTIGINYNEITYPDYDKYIINEENLNLEISINSNNNLLIKDLKNNKEAILEDKYIDYMMIIKNNNKYTILLRGLNEYQNDTIIYYSDFINLTDLVTSYPEDYLNLIIKSIITIDKAPTTSRLGYITSLDNNVKYPFVETSSDKFIYYESDLYILDRDYIEELPQDNINQNEPNQEEINKEDIDEVPLPTEVEIPEYQEQTETTQEINENNTREDS